jgi:hypothetical protein
VIKTSDLPANLNKLTKIDLEQKTTKTKLVEKNALPTAPQLNSKLLKPLV